MYVLTEEQILEIRHDYCDCVDIILSIQDRLNTIGLVRDEDDFFEIVASAAFSYESARSQFLTDSDISSKINPNRKINLDEMFQEYIDLDDIIFSELKSKYDDIQLPRQKQKKFI